METRPGREERWEGGVICGCPHTVSGKVRVALPEGREGGKPAPGPECVSAAGPGP